MNLLIYLVTLLGFNSCLFEITNALPYISETFRNRLNKDELPVFYLPLKYLNNPAISKVFYQNPSGIHSVFQSLDKEKRESLPPIEAKYLLRSVRALEKNPSGPLLYQAATNGSSLTITGRSGDGGNLEGDDSLTSLIFRIIQRRMDNANIIGYNDMKNKRTPFHHCGNHSALKKRDEGERKTEGKPEIDKLMKLFVSANETVGANDDSKLPQVRESRSVIGNVNEQYANNIIAFPQKGESSNPRFGYNDAMSQGNVDEFVKAFSGALVTSFWKEVIHILNMKSEMNAPLSQDGDSQVSFNKEYVTTNTPSSIKSASVAKRELLMQEVEQSTNFSVTEAPTTEQENVTRTSQEFTTVNTSTHTSTLTPTPTPTPTLTPTSTPTPTPTPIPTPTVSNGTTTTRTTLSRADLLRRILAGIKLSYI